MNSSLLYHTAQAHNDDLRRAAKAARTDGLPRRTRFAPFAHLVATARLVRRRPDLRPSTVDLDVDAPASA